MSSVTRFITARSVDAYNHGMRTMGSQTEKPPVWAWSSFGLTVLVFLLFSEAISYTYGNLIPTLAAVESPTATTVRITTEDYDDPDAKLLQKEVEPELLVVPTKPITASFRATTKHLRARGGRLARFRGVHIAILNGLLFNVFSGFLNVIPGLAGSVVFRSIMHVAASVMLCRLSMLWTHYVISEPSEKPWYQRLAPRKDARKIIIPTAAYALAQQLTVLVPYALFMYARDNRTHMTKAQRNVLAYSGIIAITASLMFWVFVLFPLRVSLTRVQASLLSEEEESIVPFDRSFGGRVVPSVVGGSGKLTMKQAWATVDQASRVRIFKTYVKAIGLQVALFFAFALVISLQAFALYKCKSIRIPKFQFN